MSAVPPIGRRRHRLLVEIAVDAPDDNGGVQRSWAAAGAIWASIEPVRLAGGFAAARAEQIVTHHIVFRRRDGLTGDARLREGDRVFRIVAIEDVDDAARFRRAQCEEIGP